MGQRRERIYLSTHGNCCVFRKTVAYHTYGLKYQRRWILKWEFCQQRLNLLMVKQYFLKAKKYLPNFLSKRFKKMKEFQKFLSSFLFWSKRTATPMAMGNFLYLELNVGEHVFQSSLWPFRQIEAQEMHSGVLRNQKITMLIIRWKAKAHCVIVVHH